jgi:hypothetical protein
VPVSSLARWLCWIPVLAVFASASGQEKREFVVLVPWELHGKTGIGAEVRPEPTAFLAKEKALPTAFVTRTVSSSSFSVENLIAIGNEESKRHPGFLSLWFFISDEMVDQFWAGKFTTYLSYPMWIGPYQKLSKVPWQVARYLSWQDSAVLDLRDLDGNIIHRIVRGSDFLKLREKGLFADIVGFSQMGPNEQLELPYFIVFARSYSGLNEKVAQMIWDRFRKVNARLVQISLHRDPWFIPDVLFPVFNPFEGNTTPPTESEWDNPSYLLCSGPPRNASPSCSMMNDKLSKPPN